MSAGLGLGVVVGVRNCGGCGSGLRYLGFQLGDKFFEARLRGVSCLELRISCRELLHEAGALLGRFLKLGVLGGELLVGRLELSHRLRDARPTTWLG